MLDEKPRDEVAAELGVTPATFDVLLHRAIASLEEEALGETERDGDELTGDDNDVEPTTIPTRRRRAEEVAASKRLRDALEDAVGDASTPDAARARALARARRGRPAPLDDESTRRSLDDVPTAEELELAASSATRSTTSGARVREHRAPRSRAALAPPALDDAEHRAHRRRARSRRPQPSGGNVVALRRRAPCVRVASASSHGRARARRERRRLDRRRRPARREAPLAKARSTQPLFRRAVQGRRDERAHRSDRARARVRLPRQPLREVGRPMSARRSAGRCRRRRRARARRRASRSAARVDDGDADEAHAPVDTEIMAFLSEARALHHQANLKEEAGDLAGRRSARWSASSRRAGRIPSARRPRSKRSSPTRTRGSPSSSSDRRASSRARADGGRRAGSSTRPEPTYFRGHLVEVAGPHRGGARRASSPTRASRDEATQAREKAIQLLEEVVKIQDQVIQRSLGGTDASARGRPMRIGTWPSSVIATSRGLVAAARPRAERPPGAALRPQTATGAGPPATRPRARRSRRRRASASAAGRPTADAERPARRPSGGSARAAASRAVALQQASNDDRGVAARARRRGRRLPQRVPRARLDGPRRRPPLRPRAVGRRGTPLRRREDTRVLCTRQGARTRAARAPT